MRERDLTAATILTGFRLLLILFFGWLVWQHRLVPATAVFAAAWALDGVDGWLARWWRQETEFGSLLDKVTDRILIVGGVVMLVRVGLVPDTAVLLLTKDLAMLPAVTIHATRGEKVSSLGKSGKIVTALQGSSVLWLLLGWPWQLIVILSVALIGGVAGAVHLRQVAYG